MSQHSKKRAVELNKDGKPVRLEELTHDSPFLPASEVEKYTSILPWAAERFFTYWEKEQSFRTSHMNRSLFVEAFLTTLGLVSATIIAIGFLWIAGYSLYLNRPIYAVAILCTELTALVLAIYRLKRK